MSDHHHESSYVYGYTTGTYDGAAATYATCWTCLRPIVQLHPEDARYNPCRPWAALGDPMEGPQL